MEETFSRTGIILGEEKLKKLKESHVAVFGLGGVGGNAAEALCRSGIGKLTLVDKDIVEKSNINRQLFATGATIGIEKTVAAKERLLSINPNLELDLRQVFFLHDTVSEFDFKEFDFILDCIDNVTAKILLVQKADLAGVPIISAMGAGNKLYPELLEISDIYKTNVCPLAKVMRKELKTRGVKKLTVVYSKEEPVVRTTPPGSSSFVPPVMGIIMAGYVVRSICEIK